MKKPFALFFLLVCAATLAQAQPHFPYNGVQDQRPDGWLLKNATIVSSPGQTLEGADLLLHEGRIEAIGKGLKLPKGYRELDMKGKFIYPSFIELHSSYGLLKGSSSGRNRNGGPQLTPAREGAFGANDAIKADMRAEILFHADAKAAAALRKAGFGAVVTHQADGIARGTATLVAVGDGPDQEQLLRASVTAHYSFSKGSSTQDYPSSLMGSIALLRQTYLDAQWYQTNKNKLQLNDLALDGWLSSAALPQLFETSNKYDLLRADKIGDEFGIQYIIKGTGEEYQYLDAVKASKASLIVPVNFLNALDVEDPFDAMEASLSEMKHWEMAPGNLAALHQAGIKFAITQSGVDAAADFWGNLRLAVEYGLDPAVALSALTTVPAQLSRQLDLLGTLEKGKLANFIVTSGPLFDKETELYDNWVKGQRYEVNPMPEGRDIRANYNFRLANDSTYEVQIKGKMSRPEGELIVNDTTKLKLSLSYANGFWSVWFEGKNEQLNGVHRLSMWSVGADLEGKYTDAAGISGDARWTYVSAFKEKEKKEKELKNAVIGYLPQPFADLGYDSLPKAETFLFRNATVWTNEKEGILTETDVVVSKGKLAAVGKKLNAAAYGANVRVIDASGKHITAGIIDEHSHIAISRGVNEGSNSITAEVRIGDALNPDDVNIYRQLAGGVTSANLLHGSANSIGGQAQLIKLRWGVANPEALKFEGAPGFIKFALGENVKQSNWGDRQTVRFPQTRMGVEQVMMDGFLRAKAYEEQRKTNAVGTRRDLTLETLNEIRNNQRFITCHSYVQSEINMLMKLGDSVGFKVNTFTHILEGYKVADKMKAHGANASTFADWWSYKMEVADAIPHNAGLMAQQGVNVAINSDDAEMARRLNQEAAKSVMYTGMPEEEAFKMVTLNAAKMLRVDQRVGSIKVGKDADIVLWNGHPLSIYSKPDMTLVDGIAYFEASREAERSSRIASERQRLIEKMVLARKNGAKASRPKFKVESFWHCDTLGEFAE